MGMGMGMGMGTRLEVRTQIDKGAGQCQGREWGTA